MESLYCTIFIVDVSQNPEEVETVSSRIQQLIEDHGGIIKRNNPWGKQKLAYPIQNKNYGFYVEIEFTANSHLNIPKTIEQEYRINDRVLRYLTYVVTKKELQHREINAAKMKADSKPVPSADESSPKSKIEDAAKSEDESPREEKVEENVDAGKIEDEGSAAIEEKAEEKEEEKKDEQEREQETQESVDVEEGEDVEKEKPQQEEIPEDKKE